MNRLIAVTVALLIACLVVTNLIQESRISALERSRDLQTRNAIIIHDAILELTKNQDKMITIWSKAVASAILAEQETRDPIGPKIDRMLAAPKAQKQAWRLAYTPESSRPGNDPENPIISFYILALRNECARFQMFSSLYGVSGYQRQSDYFMGFADCLAELIPEGYKLDAPLQ